MENESPEPHDIATLPAKRIERWDGWTGEKIAIFCETLAETAVVAEACDEANMSVAGAYAARRRNPLFAAAWDAALTIARERLADTLLARSMEGNVEQIWRDGKIVGERHTLDNRLGLAILRRLDRLAETGLSTSSRGVHAASAPAPALQPVDWTFAIEALRTGDDAGVAQALALAKSYEVEEVEGPPGSLSQRDLDEEKAAEREAARFYDLSERCWVDGIDGNWLTDFPPPPGFKGYESRDYDDDEDPDERYIRECTPGEVTVLEAERARLRAAERAEDEELRDYYYAQLGAEWVEMDNDEEAEQQDDSGTESPDLP
ncbi:MAG: hypothetical protein V4513_06580 [Pseudomonadota bacterium]